MGIIINDDDKCDCGAYWNTNKLWCTKGHPKGYPLKCECGGTYTQGLDVWASRIRCINCGDYYDL